MKQKRRPLQYLNIHSIDFKKSALVRRREPLIRIWPQTSSETPLYSTVNVNGGKEKDHDCGNVQQRQE